jgi:hypothetical protein
MSTISTGSVLPDKLVQVCCGSVRRKRVRMCRELNFPCLMAVIRSRNGTISGYIGFRSTFDLRVQSRNLCSTFDSANIAAMLVKSSLDRFLMIMKDNRKQLSFISDHLEQCALTCIDFENSGGRAVLVSRIKVRNWQISVKFHKSMHTEFASTRLILRKSES